MSTRVFVASTLEFVRALLALAESLGALMDLVMSFADAESIIGTSVSVDLTLLVDAAVNVGLLMGVLDLLAIARMIYESALCHRNHTTSRSKLDVRIFSESQLQLHEIVNSLLCTRWISQFEQPFQHLIYWIYHPER